MKKTFLFLGLAFIAGSLIWLVSSQGGLSLQTLTRHQAEWQNFVTNHWLAAIALYMLAYTIATGLSIPGASFLTLTGGWLFGTLAGTVATVIAATLGAVGVFLTARFALTGGNQKKNTERKHAGPGLQQIEKAFVENGFSYLLVLRLVPLFPFWLVNLAPAFTTMPVRVYLWSTFLGIIPGSFVYVSVGHGLGKLLSNPGSVSPALLWQPSILVPLLGLAFLAMIPVFYKFWQKRKHP